VVTVFTKVLQVGGYHVIGFTNPLFFIDYLHEFPDKIEFILIDYRMSQMTGCELANQIYAINPKIKKVLLTAYDDIVNNALNLDIIKKPITMNNLIQIVTQYIYSY
jgi:two-component SAPR family response regulator